MTTTPSSNEIRVGPVVVTFRLEAEQTGGGLTMFEFAVPPKARVPVPHSHDAFDETVYGLSGIMTWSLDGQAVSVGPGDVLFIPRGHVHGFENQGDEPTRMLSVITPGILGPSYFRDMAEVLAAGGPPDVTRLMDVMRKHGLRPVMPGPSPA